MDILGALTSGGLGAVTGLLGNFLNTWTSLKMKKLDNEHELRMVDATTKASIAEAEANIKVARVKTEGAIELKEAEAFQSSLNNVGQNLFDSTYMGSLMKSKWTAWIGSIISMLFALVDVARAACRPFLTFYLIAATTWVTWMCYGVLKMTNNDMIMTAERAYDLWDKVIMTVMYLTVTAVTWWFGSRGNKHFDQLKKK